MALTKERRAAPRSPHSGTSVTAELPPGPRHPAFVQTLQWIRDPERFMTRNRRRYGDAFSARLGPRTDVVFLSDPAAAAESFRGPPEDTDMGDRNGLLRRVRGRTAL